MGDLRAQVTAVKTGERRFLDSSERYGREPVLGRDQGHQGSLRSHGAGAHAHDPDGVYEAESPTWTTTASTSARKCRLKWRVIVKGDEMTIDLSNVSRQVRGFYNSGITTGYACTQVAYKCRHFADRLSDQ